MKKFLLVLSAMILCIFCLVSCNNNKDKYLQYEEAVRKDPTPANAYQLVSALNEKAEASAEEGGSAKADIEVSFSVSGVKTSMEIAMDYSWTKDNICLILDLGELGGKIEMTYVDGIAYSSMVQNGETVKYKMSMTKEDVKKELSDILSSSGSMIPSDMISNLDKESLKFIEDDFKNADIKVSEENITITLNALEVEAIKNALSEMKGDLGEDAPDIDEVTVSIVIDKDANISKLSFSVSVDSEIMEQKTSISVTTDIELSKPGVIPEIKAPADADEYEEYSSEENIDF